MIGGQVADLEGEGKPPDAELLETIHRAKTGALLRASLRMGAIYAGASEAQYAALSCYGEHVGLAFQIVDDILDVEESSEALGKTAGKDAAQHKITFPAVYGLETSRRMAEEECARAHAVLAPFGDARGAAARTGRPDRPPQIMKTRAGPAAGGARTRRIAREGAGADHGRRGPASTARRPPSPAQPVDDDARVEVLARPPYVSRGGFKLAGALRAFRHRRGGQGLPGCRLVHRRLHRRAAASAARRACMPWMCGAGQLDWKLRTDPRVVAARGHQRARARRFEEIGEPADLLVCDVSFISVTLILPAVVPLLQPGGQMVILIKPQFEVGKGQVGKGGIVRDPELHQAACERVRTGRARIRIRNRRSSKAPSLGAEGNKEFLLYAHH